MTLKRLGIGLSLTIAVVAIGFAVLGPSIDRVDPLFELRVLEGAEPVYRNRSITLPDDSVVKESCFDLPLPAASVANSLKRELASAIERKSLDGYVLVVPRTVNGRIQVAESPRVSIVVGSGRIKPRAASHAGEWSYVIVRERRDPSVIESVWRWIGERFRA